MSDKIKDIMGDTIEKVKSMASVDTIIGEPVDLGDGIKVIPVSKVSYGFASGGSDIPTSKTQRDVFGGGGGAGMTVTPVAFLVMQNGNVKLLNVDLKPTSIDKAVELIPDMFDRVMGAINSKKDKKSTEEVIDDTIKEMTDDEIREKIKKEPDLLIVEEEVPPVNADKYTDISSQSTPKK